MITASLVPGCLPLGCGSFNGNGDKLYRRGADSLIICENGGFVANLQTRSIEGKYIANPADSSATGFGVRGDDGQLAFDLYTSPDGTARTPQLDDAPWQVAGLDRYGLDHADIQCTDLVSRPWWTAQ